MLNEGLRFLGVDDLFPCPLWAASLWYVGREKQKERGRRQALRKEARLEALTVGQRLDGVDVQAFHLALCYLLQTPSPLANSRHLPGLSLCVFGGLQMRVLLFQHNMGVKEEAVCDPPTQGMLDRVIFPDSKNMAGSPRKWAAVGH